MDYKKAVSDALKESEKEKQESEIKKIKDIVKSYLEKITEKEKAKTEIAKEIQVLKDDLNDLKAGRLDKIEEKQGKDKAHDGFTLVIIKRIEKEYVPMYPWKSPWVIERKVPFVDISNTGINWGTNSTIFTSTGVSFQNFTSGTYDINGTIINL